MTPPSGDRRQAIISATLDLLAEDGVAGATVDGVAARAGVGKATIYRHWGSRAGLVADACESVIEAPPTPETGDLRADLITFFEGLAVAMRDARMSCIVPSVLDAARRDEEMARLRDEMVARRRRPVRHILAQAQARGELSRHLDLELAIDVLAGPFFYRNLMTGEPPDPARVVQVIDAVLPGLIAARPARRPVQP